MQVAGRICPAGPALNIRLGLVSVTVRRQKHWYRKKNISTEIITKISSHPMHSIQKLRQFVLTNTGIAWKCPHLTSNHPPLYYSLFVLPHDFHNTINKCFMHVAPIMLLIFFPVPEYGRWVWPSSCHSWTLGRWIPWNDRKTFSFSCKTLTKGPQPIVVIVFVAHIRINVTRSLHEWDQLFGNSTPWTTQQ